MYRLGFPVKVLGAPLRSHDSRHWQNSPHLSVSLAYVRDILEYLHAQQIFFYRLAGQLAPYATHPALPQFHHQIAECSTELAAIGDTARLYAIRLTLHPGHFIQLNSPDPLRVRRSVDELVSQTALLDAMGLDSGAVIVIHVGGRYADRLAARRRFVTAFEQLPARVQQRLALEHDDRLYDLGDVLWIHRRAGIPVVFDTLHHRCLNRQKIALLDGLAMALATWPPHQRPKIHVSSPRTEVRHLRRGGAWHVQAPLPNQHSDFLNPFEVVELLRGAQAQSLRTFDIMLEAKAKDLALLRLREQVLRYGPGLRVG
ncbi:MAG: UV DNA damage repair endonuclease UvsE [Caldilineaceae bacterium]|nr:UV DNA damage repair endonuclease UvsE [Caldilineaceae bacterium]